MSTLSIIENNQEIRGQSVSTLKPGAHVEGCLLVRTASQRLNKNGRPYYDVLLADRTGEISCKMWDISNTACPPANSVVSIKGEVELFRDRLQLKLTFMEEATQPVDMSSLVTAAPKSADEMMEEITAVIDGFGSEKLKALTRRMLEKAAGRLGYFPAAMRLHHAEKSGLLHHTTDMLHVARAICECYPGLRRDLLFAGVIVHDLAKTVEMDSDENGIVRDYTVDGNLIGHIVRGVVWLEEAARETGVMEGEKRPELVQLLEHMMLSHHGVPEFGSVRYPSFPEALVLNMIDNLDANLNEMQSVLGRVTEGAFSERIPYMDDRRIYHPFYTDDAD